MLLQIHPPLESFFNVCSLLLICLSVNRQPSSLNFLCTLRHPSVVNPSLFQLNLFSFSSMQRSRNKEVLAGSQWQRFICLQIHCIGFVFVDAIVLGVAAAKIRKNSVLKGPGTCLDSVFSFSCTQVVVPSSRRGARCCRRRCQRMG